MKIPDAYIAKGGLGVSGPAQYSVGAAMAEGNAIADTGQSLTFFGAVLSSMNKGLNDARLKVRADEINLQTEPLMEEAAKAWRTKHETENPESYLTPSLSDFNKNLDEVRNSIVQGLPKDDERISLQVRHSAAQTQKSIYDRYSAEFGKADATRLKGALDANIALEGGIIATMPLNKTADGQTDLENMTEVQHGAIRKLHDDIDYHSRSGLIFPNANAQMKSNISKDVVLATLNTEVQRGPENALHFMNKVNRGEPVFGIRDKETLKPIMEAARNTYVSHVNMDQTNYNLAQREVNAKSNVARKQYQTIIDTHPDVNVVALLDHDPELVESDSTALRNEYRQAQEHIKTGPKASDGDTVNMIESELGQLMFGGNVQAMRSKILANQSHLEHNDRDSFLRRTTEAEVNQRTLARAKSANYAKDLYGNGKSFLQQISGLVMGSPETDEHKAYSVLGKITEKIILNPDMTPKQVDEAFYPILREAYGTLSKPKQNIPALQSWINKMPDTGEAGAAKRTFNDILKQQVDIIKEKKAVADAEAQRDPSRTVPKEPWEFQKTYKDLTDKLKKAWEGK